MTLHMELLQAHNFAVGFASLSLNSALLFSLLAHYEPDWHQLRVFLGLGFVVDGLFSLAEIFGQVAISTSNGVAVMFSMGIVGHLGRYASSLCLFAYCSLVYVSFFVVPSTFAYRYFLLNRSSSHHMKIIILAAVALCCLPSCYILYTLLPNDQEAATLLSEMDAEVGEEFGTFALIGGRFSDTNLRAVFVAIASEFTLSYSVMVFFVVKISRFLREHRSLLSSKTKRMHQRLTRALIIQAAYPALSWAFPHGAIIGLTIAGARVGVVLPLVLGAFLSWIPLVNAAVALAFYNPYRRHLFRIFKRLVPKNQTAPPTRSNAQ